MKPESRTIRLAELGMTAGRDSVGTITLRAVPCGAVPETARGGNIIAGETRRPTTQTSWI